MHPYALLFYLGMTDDDLDDLEQLTEAEFGFDRWIDWIHVLW
jgi:hypothetical protein